MPTRSSTCTHESHCRPLPTRPPTPARNGGRILCQRAAVGSERDAGSHDRDAHAEVGGAVRFAFPPDANARQEIVARRALLVERRGLARAVVADRRRAHVGACARRVALRQSSRKRRGSSTRLSSMRRLSARIPALRDRLAGEVDDGVARRPRRAPPPRGSRSDAIVTASPRARSAAARCRPTKPEPPSSKTSS